MLHEDFFLSGYRLMWMFVFFDLPVVEEDDRKAYTEFRKFLLDEGFSMSQYSVYTRLMASKEAFESCVKRIQKALPHAGKVDIVGITDKQYENIISFRNFRRQAPQKQPEQLLLF
jgi:CRISPR-associated protein Cas2